MPKKAHKKINGNGNKPATRADIEELAQMSSHAFAKVVSKEDAKQFLKKTDAKQFLTKEDAKQFVTKEDAKQFATKQDVQAVKKDVQEVKDKQDLMQSDIERLVQGVDKLLEDRQASPTGHSATHNIPQRVTKLEHDVAVLKLRG